MVYWFIALAIFVAGAAYYLRGEVLDRKRSVEFKSRYPWPCGFCEGNGEVQSLAAAGDCPMCDGRGALPAAEGEDRA